MENVIEEILLESLLYLPSFVLLPHLSPIFTLLPTFLSYPFYISHSTLSLSILLSLHSPPLLVTLFLTYIVPPCIPFLDSFLRFFPLLHNRFPSRILHPSSDLLSPQFLALVLSFEIRSQQPL